MQNASFTQHCTYVSSNSQLFIQTVLDRCGDVQKSSKHLPITMRPVSNSEFIPAGQKFEFASAKYFVRKEKSAYSELSDLARNVFD